MIKRIFPLVPFFLLGGWLEAQVVCASTPQINISGATFNGTAVSLIGTTEACSVGASQTAASVCAMSNSILAEGTTADNFETTVAFGDATADATLTLTGSATGVTASGFGTLSAANLTVSSGVLTVPDGTSAAPSVRFSDADTGFYSRSGAGYVDLTLNGTHRIEFQNQYVMFGSATIFGWSATTPTASKDIGFARRETGVLLINDGLNTNVVGSLAFARNVETVATTKSPSAVESMELYTNGADVDGQAITLPNDPTAGICYEFALTSTDTSNSFSIAPSAGETLQDAGVSCATAFTATAKGATARICAVSGGAGGLWLVMSKNGTWTCS